MAKISTWNNLEEKYYLSRPKWGWAPFREGGEQPLCLQQRISSNRLSQKTYFSPILKLSRAFKIEGNLFASENIEIK